MNEKARLSATSATTRPDGLEAMHEKPQEGGKPLLVTMADRQPGEGKGYLAAKKFIRR